MIQRVYIEYSGKTTNRPQAGWKGTVVNMTRDVTIEQEASGTATAALNRRAVLGALSLGLVAAACSSGGSSTASGEAVKKTVKSGDSAAGDEIKVALPSRESAENPAEKTEAPADGVSSIDESGSGSGSSGSTTGGTAMPSGGSVPSIGEVTAPPQVETPAPAPAPAAPAPGAPAPAPGAENPTVTPAAPQPKPAPAPGLPKPEVPLSLGTGVEAVRVANRLTFGTTPAVQADILDRGTAGFIENQLALNTPDPVVEAKLAGFSTIGQTRQAQFAAVTNGKDNEVGRIELTMANALRATESENQLFEVMCQLWMDHLNVSLHDKEFESLVTAYQEEVIRPHAMGNFSDMLQASAEHPAMLIYLDAATNDANNPEGINENYGREILELHTLGKSPQIYDEDDVRAAAFAFTGWTFDMNQNSDTFLEFQFDEGRHFTEDISLLDGAFTRGATTGKDTADALISFLVSHPQTAQTIARKLCIRFVDDTPSDELVNSTAAVFAANNTAIIPTLVHIFNSQEFADSDGEKFRRPYEGTIATLRAMGTALPTDPASEGAKALRDQIASMGNEPWMKDTPDGYSDQATAWLSTANALDFWNSSASLVIGTLSAEITSDNTVLRGGSATAGELVLGMASQFGLGVIPAETQTAVLTAVGANAATPVADLSDAQVEDIASLLCAHPLFCIR